MSEKQYINTVNGLWVEDAEAKARLAEHEELLSGAIEDLVGSTLANLSGVASIVKADTANGYTLTVKYKEANKPDDVITIASGGGTWGSITGDLADQTDLQEALDGKLDTSGGTIDGDLVVKNLVAGSQMTVRFDEDSEFADWELGSEVNNEYTAFAAMRFGDVPGSDFHNRSGAIPSIVYAAENDMASRGAFYFLGADNRTDGESRLAYVAYPIDELDAANKGYVDEQIADHTHDGYASSSHSHSPADIGAAEASHSHSKSQITDFPTLATVATSGSYNDLANKPSIPAAVTESTVSGWGFTKNTGTGTYSKPSGGIPKTDLASAVQTSLNKADAALPASSVSDWAKAATKPSYTASEVGAAPASSTLTITGTDVNGGSHSWTVYGSGS